MAQSPDVRDPSQARLGQRTLVLVNRAAEAGHPEPAVDVVVLDMSWTPRPGERPDLISLRPALTSVLRREDLFEGSLKRLDAWADEAGLADRFTVDGVTWWYRIRMIVRWDLHELILWRLVLDELASRGRYSTIVIPARRRRLAEAARATGSWPARPDVVTVADAVARTWDFRTWRRWAGRVASRGLRMARKGIRQASRPHELAQRNAILDARVDVLRGRRNGVLAYASARFFQVVHSSSGNRLIDPHLTPVLEKLAEEGQPVATFALGLDHRREVDWNQLEVDDQLLPESLIKRLWSDPSDDAIDSSDVAAGLEGIVRIPLEVEGWDLGPALGTIVGGYAHGWLDGQRLGMRRAQRLMRDLQPSVLFLDHEGIRTSWLAAARQQGIPIVAVQHGVIYAHNPEYVHPWHPALVRPDTTCVFGPFERELLVGQGGYHADTVVVTGSSRSDPGAMSASPSPRERADVRTDLGVAEGDRLLVVSVGHNPVAGDLHSGEMVARLLGGPLPKTHVVFKLHPQDRTGGPYEAVLRGLARAGRYSPPPTTVVRNYDLYRLLRCADAHLGQYSTVLTDAVVAGTPNMIAVGLAYGDMLGYVTARVAVPVECVDDVRSFMREPRAAAPADRARFLDAHFCPGDATGRIVAAIHDARVRFGAARDANI